MLCRTRTHHPAHAQRAMAGPTVFLRLLQRSLRSLSDAWVASARTYVQAGERRYERRRERQFAQLFACTRYWFVGLSWCLGLLARAVEFTESLLHRAIGHLRPLERMSRRSAYNLTRDACDSTASYIVHRLTIRCRRAVVCALRFSRSLV